MPSARPRRRPDDTRQRQRHRWRARGGAGLPARRARECGAITHGQSNLLVVGYFSASPCMRETKGHASVLKLGAVIGITLLGVTGGSGMLIASSGGEDEVVQQVRTTRSAGTVATEAAASSTAPVVPENWLAYADPQGLYSFS